VDGYDNSSGQHQVHANYGWNDGHNAWYTLDKFDCDNAAGYQGGCDIDNEELIRRIYPRDGLCGTVAGTLAGDVYSYIYCDVTSSNLTIQTGAWVQFLGGVNGTKMTCSGNSIDISSSANNDTRFFSKGDPSKGLKLTGAQIKLSTNGSISIH
jgi:hypothetical protein